MAALGNVLLAWFNRSFSWKLVWASDSDRFSVYDGNFYYFKWVTEITQWLMTQQVQFWQRTKTPLRADCRAVPHIAVFCSSMRFPSNLLQQRRMYNAYRSVAFWCRRYYANSFLRERLKIHRLCYNGNDWKRPSLTEGLVLCFSND